MYVWEYQDVASSGFNLRLSQQPEVVAGQRRRMEARWRRRQKERRGERKLGRKGLRVCPSSFSSPFIPFFFIILWREGQMMAGQKKKGPSFSFPPSPCSYSPLLKCCIIFQHQPYFYFYSLIFLSPAFRHSVFIPEIFCIIFRFFISLSTPLLLRQSVL